MIDDLSLTTIEPQRNTKIMTTARDTTQNQEQSKPSPWMQQRTQYLEDICWFVNNHHTSHYTAQVITSYCIMKLIAQPFFDELANGTH